MSISLSAVQGFFVWSFLRFKQWQRGFQQSRRGKQKSQRNVLALLCV